MLRKEIDYLIRKEKKKKREPRPRGIA